MKTQEENNSSLRILIIKPNRVPYEKQISAESELAELQTIVGGHIEAFNALSKDFDGATLYVNDEGLFTCFPNRAIYATKGMEGEQYLSQFDYSKTVKEGELFSILFGNIVATGFEPVTGCNKSLTDSQIKKITEYFTHTSKINSGLMEVLRIKANQK